MLNTGAKEQSLGNRREAPTAGVPAKACIYKKKIEETGAAEGEEGREIKLPSREGRQRGRERGERKVCLTVKR